MGFYSPVVFVLHSRGHNQAMSYVRNPVVHRKTVFFLTCRSTPTPLDAPHSPLYCSVRTDTPPHVTLLHHWRPAAASLWGLLELHWPQLELLAQRHSWGCGWSCSLPLSACFAQIAVWQKKNTTATRAITIQFYYNYAPAWYEWIFLWPPSQGLLEFFFTWTHSFKLQNVREEIAEDYYKNCL